MMSDSSISPTGVDQQELIDQSHLDEIPYKPLRPTYIDIKDGTKKAEGSASFLRAARAGNIEKVLEFLKNGTDINTCNANGLNALHLASKEGHIEVVKELINRGANVDAATKKGNSALHIASLAGQEEIVKILVENGANVNVQSQNGFTPLYMAAQENHDVVVTFLLLHGANQSLATEDGFTPLAVALQQGHDKVVALLLENDTRGKVRLPALHIAAKKDDTKAAGLLLQNEHNPDVTSKSGFTPLHIAAHYGNENIAKVLLEKGANVNFQARHAITPLHVAAKWGRANLVTLLVAHAAVIDSKTRDLLTPLHCAARSGHDQVVDLLLEKGAPITAKTKNGLAPLHMAAQGDHVDSARILLYHRAPVDDVTVDYLTPLHVAAHCGHVRVAKLLLDRGADPNSRALNGFTPLHIACKKNRIKVVELLLKYQANIEHTTESGLTPLHVASFMGGMNIVIFLIQHNAVIDPVTVRGETPLHLAARANQTDIVRILLRNGAQVDARAREQQTPLHIASRLGNTDIVALLLQAGAAPDAVTKDFYSPLHIAAKEGQEEIAAVLLDHKTPMETLTKKGFSPLHLAAKYGNLNVAKLLLERGAEVDILGKNQVTPLHVAAHYDHQNVAHLLLEHKASPQATAKNGYTPLHIAAKKNQLDIAATLMEFGANVNAESKAGFTPLHLASQEGLTGMATNLLDHGAHVNAGAKNGLTPMHLCAQEDKVEVAKILKDHGSKIDSQTKAGYTPLHVACHFGQLAMVRFLLEQQADVNLTTRLGFTPLHQAAQQGHAAIVKILLDHGAQPNAKTTSGQTPYAIAQRLGYVSVVETLRTVTTTEIITETHMETVEKYKHEAPETMQETFMSDSEDEGGTLDRSRVSRLSGTDYLKLSPFDSLQPNGSGGGNLSYEDTLRLSDSFLNESARLSTSTPTGKIPVATPEMLSPNGTLQLTPVRPDRHRSSNGRQQKFSDWLSVGEEGPGVDQQFGFGAEDMQGLREETTLPPDRSLEQDQLVSLIQQAAAAPTPITQLPLGTTIEQQQYQLEGHFLPDNVEIDHTAVHTGFLISFMVDARGGAMRGCRHSGVRIIVPPRKAPMPMRITCRYLRRDKLVHPPPLSEGEALASRVLEMGPAGAKFLGPVILEIPHFASLRGREREVVILRSDDGEHWKEHQLETTEDAVQEVLNESFDAEELNQLEDLQTTRISRILTSDFPQYFAIVTRIRQEVHAVGPEGGMIASTVVPQVQAVFPEGALTKTIKVSLQAHPISHDLVGRLHGNRVAVSPIITVEPRRRKFHKPITLTIPLPQASGKSVASQFSTATNTAGQPPLTQENPPTLRLLCSITGGQAAAQWEDITGTTQLNFNNENVSFTTTVSARFWILDCQTPRDAARIAQEIYTEAIVVPYMAKFVVFARRNNQREGQIRVFCMTDDKEDKTLEKQECFKEVAKSRDVEVLAHRHQFLEFAGNILPFTKSGEQLCLYFVPFQENRLSFVSRVKDSEDPTAPVGGRIAFMREAKLSRPDSLQQQHPICTLNCVLPEFTGQTWADVSPETSADQMTLDKKYSQLRGAGVETVHKADLRLSDIARELGSDWEKLAAALGLPQSDVSQIRTEYAGREAIITLRIWYERAGRGATGNQLERALKKIGRDDIVKKCIFNVETVTSEREKLEARLQLLRERSEEEKLAKSPVEVEVKPVAPGRPSKQLQHGDSLDVSYDEREMAKAEAQRIAEEPTTPEHPAVRPVELQSVLRPIGATDDIVIRAAPTSPKSPGESRRQAEIFARSRLDAAELPEPQGRIPPEPQVFPHRTGQLHHLGDSWESPIPAATAKLIAAGQLKLESTGLTDLLPVAQAEPHRIAPTPTGLTELPKAEKADKTADLTTTATTTSSTTGLTTEADKTTKITTTTTSTVIRSTTTTEQPVVEEEFVAKVVGKDQPDAVVKRPEMISESDRLRSLQAAAETLVTPTKKSPGGGPSDEEGQFYEEEVTVTQKPFEIEVKTSATRPPAQTSVDLKKSFDGSDVSGETVIYRSTQPAKSTEELVTLDPGQHWYFKPIGSESVRFIDSSTVSLTQTESKRAGRYLSGSDLVLPYFSGSAESEPNLMSSGGFVCRPIEISSVSEEISLAYSGSQHEFPQVIVRQRQRCQLSSSLPSLTTEESEAAEERKRISTVAEESEILLDSELLRVLSPADRAEPEELEQPGDEPPNILSPNSDDFDTTTSLLVLPKDKPPPPRSLSKFFSSKLIFLPPPLRGKKRPKLSRSVEQLMKLPEPIGTRPTLYTSSPALFLVGLNEGNDVDVTIDFSRAVRRSVEAKVPQRLVERSRLEFQSLFAQFIRPPQQWAKANAEVVRFEGEKRRLMSIFEPNYYSVAKAATVHVILHRGDFNQLAFLGVWGEVPNELASAHISTKRPSPIPTVIVSSADKQPVEEELVEQQMVDKQLETAPEPLELAAIESDAIELNVDRQIEAEIPAELIVEPDIIEHKVDEQLLSEPVLSPEEETVAIEQLVVEIFNKVAEEEIEQLVQKVDTSETAEPYGFLTEEQIRIQLGTAEGAKVEPTEVILETPADEEIVVEPHKIQPVDESAETVAVDVETEKAPELVIGTTVEEEIVDVKSSPIEEKTIPIQPEVEPIEEEIKVVVPTEAEATPSQPVEEDLPLESAEKPAESVDAERVSVDEAIRTESIVEGIQPEITTAAEAQLDEAILPSDLDKTVVIEEMIEKTFVQAESLPEAEIFPTELIGQSLQKSEEAVEPSEPETAAIKETFEEAKPAESVVLPVEETKSAETEPTDQTQTETEAILSRSDKLRPQKSLESVEMTECQTVCEHLEPLEYSDLVEMREVSPSQHASVELAHGDILSTAEVSQSEMEAKLTESESLQSIPDDSLRIEDLTELSRTETPGDLSEAEGEVILGDIEVIQGEGEEEKSVGEDLPEAEVLSDQPEVEFYLSESQRTSIESVESVLRELLHQADLKSQLETDQTTAEHRRDSVEEILHLILENVELSRISELQETGEKQFGHQLVDTKSPDTEEFHEESAICQCETAEPQLVDITVKPDAEETSSEILAVEEISPVQIEEPLESNFIETEEEISAEPISEAKEHPDISAIILPEDIEQTADGEISADEDIIAEILNISVTHVCAAVDQPDEFEDHLDVDGKQIEQIVDTVEQPQVLEEAKEQYYEPAEDQLIPEVPIIQIVDSVNQSASVEGTSVEVEPISPQPQVEPIQTELTEESVEPTPPESSLPTATEMETEAKPVESEQLKEILSECKCFPEELSYMAEADLVELTSLLSELLDEVDKSVADQTEPQVTAEFTTDLFGADQLTTTEYRSSIICSYSEFSEFGPMEIPMASVSDRSGTAKLSLKQISTESEGKTVGLAEAQLIAELTDSIVIARLMDECLEQLGQIPPMELDDIYADLAKSSTADNVESILEDMLTAVVILCESHEDLQAVTPTTPQTEASTTQQKEFLEEGFLDETGQMVISKRVTRVVTTTRTVVDGKEAKSETVQTKVDKSGSVLDGVPPETQMFPGVRLGGDLILEKLSRSVGDGVEADLSPGALEISPVEEYPLGPKIPVGISPTEELSPTQPPISPTFTPPPPTVLPPPAYTDKDKEETEEKPKLSVAQRVKMFEGKSVVGETVTKGVEKRVVEAEKSAEEIPHVSSLIARFSPEAKPDERQHFEERLELSQQSYSGVTEKNVSYSRRTVFEAERSEGAEKHVVEVSPQLGYEIESKVPPVAPRISLLPSAVAPLPSAISHSPDGLEDKFQLELPPAAVPVEVERVESPTETQVEVEPKELRYHPDGLREESEILSVTQPFPIVPKVQPKSILPHQGDGLTSESLEFRADHRVTEEVKPAPMPRKSLDLTEEKQHEKMRRESDGLEEFKFEFERLMEEEKLREEEEIEQMAAVKIQSAFKSFLTRKEQSSRPTSVEPEIHEEIGKIPVEIEKTAESPVVEEEIGLAATKIQSAFRGFQVRRNLADQIHPSLAHSHDGMEPFERQFEIQPETTGKSTTTTTVAREFEIEAEGEVQRDDVSPAFQTELSPAESDVDRELSAEVITHVQSGLETEKFDKTFATTISTKILPPLPYQSDGLNDQFAIESPSRSEVEVPMSPEISPESEEIPTGHLQLSYELMEKSLAYSSDGLMPGQFEVEIQPESLPGSPELVVDTNMPSCLSESKLTRSQEEEEIEGEEEGVEQPEEIEDEFLVPHSHLPHSPEMEFHIEPPSPTLLRHSDSGLLETFHIEPKLPAEEAIVPMQISAKVPKPKILAHTGDGLGGSFEVEMVPYREEVEAKYEGVTFSPEHEGEKIVEMVKEKMLPTTSISPPPQSAMSEDLAATKIQAGLRGMLTRKAISAQIPSTKAQIVDTTESRRLDYVSGGLEEEFQLERPQIPVESPLEEEVEIVDRSIPAEMKIFVEESSPEEEEVQMVDTTERQFMAQREIPTGQMTVQSYEDDGIAEDFRFEKSPTPQLSPAEEETFAQPPVPISTRHQILDYNTDGLEDQFQLEILQIPSSSPIEEEISTAQMVDSSIPSEDKISRVQPEKVEVEWRQQTAVGRTSELSYEHSGVTDEFHMEIPSEEVEVYPEVEFEAEIAETSAEPIDRRKSAEILKEIGIEETREVEPVELRYNRDGLHADFQLQPHLVPMGQQQLEAEEEEILTKLTATSLPYKPDGLEEEFEVESPAESPVELMSTKQFHSENKISVESKVYEIESGTVQSYEDSGITDEFHVERPIEQEKFSEAPRETFAQPQPTELRIPGGLEYSLDGLTDEQFLPQRQIESPVESGQFQPPVESPTEEVQMADTSERHFVPEVSAEPEDFDVEWQKQTAAEHMTVQSYEDDGITEDFRLEKPPTPQLSPAEEETFAQPMQIRPEILGYNTSGLEDQFELESPQISPVQREISTPHTVDSSIPPEIAIETPAEEEDFETEWDKQTAVGHMTVQSYEESGVTEEFHVEKLSEEIPVGHVAKEKSAEEVEQMAAVKIQSAFKSFLTRKEQSSRPTSVEPEIHEEIGKIPVEIEKTAESPVVEEEIGLAATKIQSAFRGFQVRRNLADQIHPSLAHSHDGMEPFERQIETHREMTVKSTTTTTTTTVPRKFEIESEGEVQRDDVSPAFQTELSPAESDVDRELSAEVITHVQSGLEEEKFEFSQQEKAESPAVSPVFVPPKQTGMSWERDNLEEFSIEPTSSGRIVESERISVVTEVSQETSLRPQLPESFSPQIPSEVEQIVPAKVKLSHSGDGLDEEEFNAAMRHQMVETLVEGQLLSPTQLPHTQSGLTEESSSSERQTELSPDETQLGLINDAFSPESERFQSELSLIEEVKSPQVEEEKSPVEEEFPGESELTSESEKLPAEHIPMGKSYDSSDFSPEKTEISPLDYTVDGLEAGKYHKVQLNHDIEEENIVATAESSAIQPESTAAGQHGVKADLNLAAAKIQAGLRGMLTRKAISAQIPSAKAQIVDTTESRRLDYVSSGLEEEFQLERPQIPVESAVEEEEVQIVDTSERHFVPEVSAEPEDFNVEWQIQTAAEHMTVQSYEDDGIVDGFQFEKPPTPQLSPAEEETFAQPMQIRPEVLGYYNDALEDQFELEKPQFSPSTSIEEETSSTAHIVDSSIQPKEQLPSVEQIEIEAEWQKQTAPEHVTVLPYGEDQLTEEFQPERHLAAAEPHFRHEEKFEQQKSAEYYEEKPTEPELSLIVQPYEATEEFESPSTPQHSPVAFEAETSAGPSLTEAHLSQISFRPEILDYTIDGLEEQFHTEKPQIPVESPLEEEVPMVDTSINHEEVIRPTAQMVDTSSPEETEIFVEESSPDEMEFRTVDTSARPQRIISAETPEDKEDFDTEWDRQAAVDNSTVLAYEDSGVTDQFVVEKPLATERAAITPQAEEERFEQQIPSEHPHLTQPLTEEEYDAEWRRQTAADHMTVQPYEDSGVTDEFHVEKPIETEKFGEAPRESPVESGQFQPPVEAEISTKSPTEEVQIADTSERHFVPEVSAEPEDFDVEWQKQTAAEHMTIQSYEDDGIVEGFQFEKPPTPQFSAATEETVAQPMPIRPDILGYHSDGLEDQFELTSPEVIESPVEDILVDIQTEAKRQISAESPLEEKVLMVGAAKKEFPAEPEDFDVEWQKQMAVGHTTVLPYEDDRLIDQFLTELPTTSEVETTAQMFVRPDISLEYNPDGLSEEFLLEKPQVGESPGEQKYFVQPGTSEEDMAAVKIQSAFKSFLTRKEQSSRPTSVEPEIHEEIGKIPVEIEKTAESPVVEEEIGLAATKIQSAFRGFQVRRNLADQIHPSLAHSHDGMEPFERQIEIQPETTGKSTTTTTVAREFEIEAEGEVQRGRVSPAFQTELSPAKSDVDRELSAEVITHVQSGLEEEKFDKTFPTTISTKILPPLPYQSDGLNEQFAIESPSRSDIVAEEQISAVDVSHEEPLSFEEIQAEIRPELSGIQFQPESTSLAKLPHSHDGLGQFQLESNEDKSAAGQSHTVPFDYSFIPVVTISEVEDLRVESSSDEQSETEETPESFDTTNAAATKIQSAFRGHQVRKIYEEIRSEKSASPQPSGDDFEADQSGLSGPDDKSKEELEEIDHDVMSSAATKIQSVFRGHLVRKGQEETESQRDELEATETQSAYKQTFDYGFVPPTTAENEQVESQRDEFAQLPTFQTRQESPVEEVEVETVRPPHTPTFDYGFVPPTTAELEATKPEEFGSPTSEPTAQQILSHSRDGLEPRVEIDIDDFALINAVVCIQAATRGFLQRKKVRQDSRTSTSSRTEGDSEELTSVDLTAVGQPQYPSAQHRRDSISSEEMVETGDLECQYHLETKSSRGHSRRPEDEVSEEIKEEENEGSEGHLQQAEQQTAAPVWETPVQDATGPKFEESAALSPQKILRVETPPQLTPEEEISVELIGAEGDKTEAERLDFRSPDVSESEESVLKPSSSDYDSAATDHYQTPMTSQSETDQFYSATSGSSSGTFVTPQSRLSGAESVESETDTFRAGSDADESDLDDSRTLRGVPYGRQELKASPVQSDRKFVPEAESDDQFLHEENPSESDVGEELEGIPEVSETSGTDEVVPQGGFEREESPEVFIPAGPHSGGLTVATPHERRPVSPLPPRTDSEQEIYGGPRESPFGRHDVYMDSPQLEVPKTLSYDLSGLETTSKQSAAEEILTSPRGSDVGRSTDSLDRQSDKSDDSSLRSSKRFSQSRRSSTASRKNSHDESPTFSERLTPDLQVSWSVQTGQPAEKAVEIPPEPLRPAEEEQQPEAMKFDSVYPPEESEETSEEIRLESELETVLEEPELEGSQENILLTPSNNQPLTPSHRVLRYESDNCSESSLQEFERLECELALRGDRSLSGSEVELFLAVAGGRRRPSDGSVGSIGEFERLEKECEGEGSGEGQNGQNGAKNGQSAQDVMLLSDIHEESEPEDMSVRGDEVEVESEGDDNGDALLADIHISDTPGRPDDLSCFPEFPEKSVTPTFEVPFGRQPIVESPVGDSGVGSRPKSDLNLSSEAREKLSDTDSLDGFEPLDVPPQPSSKADPMATSVDSLDGRQILAATGADDNDSLDGGVTTVLTASMTAEDRDSLGDFVLVERPGEESFVELSGGDGDRDSLEGEEITVVPSEGVEEGKTADLSGGPGLTGDDRDSVLAGSYSGASDLSSQEGHAAGQQLLSGDTALTYQSYGEDDRDSLTGDIGDVVDLMAQSVEPGTPQAETPGPLVDAEGNLFDLYSQHPLAPSTSQTHSSQSTTESSAFPHTLTTFESSQVCGDGTTEIITRSVTTRVTDPLAHTVRFVSGLESRLHSHPDDFEEFESVDHLGNVTKTTIRRVRGGSEPTTSGGDGGGSVVGGGASELPEGFSRPPRELSPPGGNGDSTPNRPLQSPTHPQSN